MSARVLVIAEAGVNHNGDLALAERLVDVAADAGADLVKFQTFVADRLATESAAKAQYQKERTGESGSQLEMLRRLELSPQAHERLRAHCERRGIGFFSTGFDEESVDMLVAMGQSRIKVPSGELTNLPFLRHVGALGKQVLLSTGMGSLEEVRAALQVLERAGTPRSRVCVLHCTTCYPAPFAEANLRAMQTMREEFGVEVGYSDHTPGIEVAMAAVALGATVIEKHFTLDRGLPGPDHAASLEPAELAAMVSGIRNIEAALGDGIKRCMPSESVNLAAARRSLVAIAPIARGERFGPHNIGARRPGTGLSPMRFDELIGKLAPRDFSPGEAIEP
jgi:N,N'-diacetyllegionaminate synthase